MVFNHNFDSKKNEAKELEAKLVDAPVVMSSTITKMAPMNIKINPLGGAVCIAVVLVLFFYTFGIPGFTTKVERISMKELLSTSVVLARRGGGRVKDIRRSDTLQEQVKGKTKEGVNEMVSQGDMQSHEAIFYGFAKAFPGLNVRFT